VLNQTWGKSADAIRLFEESLANDLGLYMAHVRMAQIYRAHQMWTRASRRRVAPSRRIRMTHLHQGVGRHSGRGGRAAEAHHTATGGQRESATRAPCITSASCSTSWPARRGRETLAVSSPWRRPAGTNTSSPTQATVGNAAAVAYDGGRHASIRVVVVSVLGLGLGAGAAQAQFGFR